MPAGMFSIDSILSGRPSCKEPLLLHRSGPVVLSAGLTDSIYTDYNGLYSSTCGPSPPGIQSVNGTRLGYNGYYYGQLHVQGVGGGPPCCSSVPGLSPQQCPCIPAGRTTTLLFFSLIVWPTSTKAWNSSVKKPTELIFLYVSNTIRFSRIFASSGNLKLKLCNNQWVYLLREAPRFPQGTDCYCAKVCNMTR